MSLPVGPRWPKILVGPFSSQPQRYRPNYQGKEGRGRDEMRWGRGNSGLSLGHSYHSHHPCSSLLVLHRPSGNFLFLSVLAVIPQTAQFSGHSHAPLAMISLQGEFTEVSPLWELPELKKSCLYQKHTLFLRQNKGPAPLPQLRTTLQSYSSF